MLQTNIPLYAPEKMLFFGIHLFLARAESAVEFCGIA